MNPQTLKRIVVFRETQKRLKEIGCIECRARTNTFAMAAREQEQLIGETERRIMQAAANAERSEWLLAESLLATLHTRRDRLHTALLAAEREQKRAEEDLTQASIRAEQAESLTQAALVATANVRQRSEQAASDDRFAARRHYERETAARVSAC